MRKFFSKTWVKVTLAILVLVVALLLSAYGTFKWLYIPSVPEPDFPEPANESEAYSQDLDYLELYADLEKAFDDEGKREAFRRRIASLRSELDTMKPERFEVAVAQAVALADNPHSNVSPISMSRRVNHFPVRTGPFEDGEFIIQARREYEHLLGAEIVAVEGHPITAVTESFVSMFGGPENRSRFFTHIYINSPALLYGQGFTAAPDGAELTVKLASGETRDVFLDGTMLPDDRRIPFGREVMDYRVPDEEAGDWVHLMAGREPPLYLDQPDEPFLYRHLDEPNGAYVRINYNYDVDGRSLTDWLEEPRFCRRGPAFQRRRHRCDQPVRRRTAFARRQRRHYLHRHVPGDVLCGHRRCGNDKEICRGQGTHRRRDGGRPAALHRQWWHRVQAAELGHIGARVEHCRRLRRRLLGLARLFRAVAVLPRGRRRRPRSRRHCPDEFRRLRGQ